ncbi:MAG: bifunctional demethylmenaquinone methyltransferase/2-methoxy-6-polyprenyl-1,4-benzoquinol methylase UbiE [Phycisphaeraceae bacterium]|nr:bifunctional demethylmenaquinone methyltransferase/2-methoxy-6-polyprenyl-1,4-benzoquinol methylase UbiE [Phycisphaeraceae bacterium]
MTAPTTMPQQEQPQGWTDADLAHDPHHDEEKAAKVRAMFGAIAGRYDLNNRLHSFGRDQAWRRATVRLLGIMPTDEALDVACGTGDLTRTLKAGGAASVVGVDFTPEMLAIARAKGDGLTYLQGDAMELPFESARFDVVTIAFGLRNVQDPARAVGEFFRVLRPGGRLAVLEFDRPSPAPIAWINDLYCRRIMPWTATLIARDRSGAYRYLPRSIETFLDRPSMRRLLEGAGFEVTAQRRMTFGVCVCHVAVKAP